MEHLYFSIEHNSVDVHVALTGFPAGSRTLRLEGKVMRRLADLALHRLDLEFSLRCLNMVTSPDAAPTDTDEALWRSALLSYTKCFGSDARSCLDAPRTLKNSADLLAHHRLFLKMRNSHIVHDGATYRACEVNGVACPGPVPDKIARVVVSVASYITYNAENVAKLRLLSTTVLAWVAVEFDEISEQTALALNTLEHADLIQAAHGEVGWAKGGKVSLRLHRSP